MTTTTDLPTKLCSWQRECPASGGAIDLGPSPRAWEGVCVAGRVLTKTVPGESGRYKNCTVCKGKSMVYVLDDSVRVPCHPEFSWATADLKLHKELVESGVLVCSMQCGGRGWTPSTDLAVWQQAIIKAGYWFRQEGSPLNTGYTEVKHYQQGLKGDSLGYGLEALQTALAQVMEKEL